ncbi:hypothetical protein ED733_000638 [Metarhizium rileyi]|uniref:Uncharacterized protein n=1 Tax=Metarhizium rileyi (strain RCEF 4871) TaxID=1649241 RepID=A0A5C6G9J6_METRR|nr:hypothetical protein ED733_000638 [Metarhizium rileyi]
MADQASGFGAIAAETDGTIPSKHDVDPRHKIRRIANYPGHSCVSKTKVAPFDPTKEKAFPAHLLEEKLICRQSTTDSFNVTRATSPQDNSARESNTTADNEKGLPKDVKVCSANRSSDVGVQDTTLQLMQKTAEERDDVMCNGLRVPVSKVRPCVLEPNPDLQSSKYPAFGPKVQPAFHHKSKPNFSGSTEPIFDFIVNQASCRGDSFSTVGSHEGHHHPSWPRKTAPVASDDHSIDNCPASYNLSLTIDERPHLGGRSESRDDGVFSSPKAQQDSVHVEAGMTKSQVSEANLDTSDIGSGWEHLYSNVELEEPSTTKAKQLGPAAGDSPTPKPFSRILHAPIPISKVRPAFHMEPIYDLQAHEHSSTPKVGPSIECLRQGSRNGRSYFDAGSAGSHGSSGHTQAVGSLFDYKRTTQWLRDVLRHPQTYTPRYTKRLGQTIRICSTSPDQKSPSPCIVFSKPKGSLSVKSENQSSRFDRTGFKRAVGDLERLLNEALAIATQVVDHPPSTTEQDACKQDPIGVRAQCRGVGSRMKEYSGSRVIFASPSVDGSSGDMAPVGSQDRTAQGQVERSPNFQPHSKLSHSCKGNTNEESGQDLAEVGGLKIPRRKSSKKLKAVFASQVENDVSMKPEVIRNFNPNPLREVAAKPGSQRTDKSQQVTTIFQIVILPEGLYTQTMVLVFADDRMLV